MADYPPELDPETVGSFDSETGRIAADWGHLKRLRERYPEVFGDL